MYTPTHLRVPAELSETDRPMLGWLRWHYGREYRVVAMRGSSGDVWIAQRHGTTETIEAREPWSLRDLMRADHERRRR